MAHHIYQTDGIVLDGFNVGESNRFLYILTKDLGLLTASVQGIRELKSKLCFSLQDFSYSKIDFVRGREIWRVTSAQNLHTLLPTTKKSPEDIFKRKIFSNIILLTKRLFTGEVAHHELFEELVSGFTFLGKFQFSKEELKSFEVIMALKILDSLGYLTEDEQYKYFLRQTEWGKDVLVRAVPIYLKAVGDINRALKEAQM